MVVGPDRPGFGLFTAFYGVIFAAVQTDMKRLLAYSSIENIGILFTGLGLAIVFHGVGMRALAALALIATLYHCLNHALMKSLLFLGTGAVLHATGERNLGRLGGLIRRMPWVAWLTWWAARDRRPAAAQRLRLRVAAAAGVPVRDQVPHTFVNMLLPIGAAVIALCTALAGYVMVKFFGVVFLGQPRESALARAHDAGLLEKLGMAWLAIGCLLAGGAAGPGHRTTWHRQPGPARRDPAPAGADWWLLVPLRTRASSYGPLLILLVGLAIMGLTALLVQACTTAGCGALRPGTAGSSGSTRACRTRPKASANRSGTSSSPSS